jgi:uncharacterized membrane protein
MNPSEMFKLIGVFILIIGLALRLRTTLVVLTAAIVTGLIAGLPLFSSVGVFEGVPYLSKANQKGIINILGESFANFRMVTLFIITLPAVGLAERYGLQAQSARLISRISAASVGRLLITYQLFRVLMGALGIRLLGHPFFVRPVIFPMALDRAQGEARVKSIEALPDADMERIKAASAASENYGNFYGQNLSPVQVGVILVYSTLKGLGYEVSLGRIILYAIPITTLSVIIGAVQFLLLDLRLRSRTSSDA